MYEEIYGLTVIEAEAYNNRSDALNAIKNRVFEPVTGLGIGTYDSAETRESRNKLLHSDDKPDDAVVGTDPAAAFAEAVTGMFQDDNSGHGLFADSDSDGSDDELHDEMVEAFSSDFSDMIESVFGVEPSELPEVTREELEKFGVDMLDAGDDSTQRQQAAVGEGGGVSDEALTSIVEKGEIVAETIEAASRDVVTPGAERYLDIGNRIERARRDDTDLSIEEVCRELPRNPVTDTVAVASLDSPAGEMLFEDAWTRHIQAVTRRYYSNDAEGMLPYEVDVDKYSDELSTTSTRIFTCGNELPGRVTSVADRDAVLDFVESSDSDVWIAPATAHH